MQLYSALPLLASIVSFLGTVQAYDIGCVYPTDMPEPFQARGALAEAGSEWMVMKKFETPMVVHKAHTYTLAQAACLAYHDENVLNPITGQSPAFRTPPAYQNSWSRTLCVAQVGWFLFPEAITPLLQDWGFTFRSTMDPDLEACGGDGACMEAVVMNKDYDPRLIAMVIRLDLLEYLETDGWNSLGKHTYDYEQGTIVDCTTNCAPYTDTYGYYPKNNHPGEPSASSDKYTVTGKDMHWQPIMEVIEDGSFIRQEHVAPHIGFNAKPALLQEFKNASDPMYDYKAEADLVVERLKQTTMDEAMKEQIKFFDGKLGVRYLIQQSLTQQAAAVLTFEDFLLFLLGISSAEHDAVLAAWREKVRYDLVRPTTVIHRWNNDVLTTFNGDPMATMPGDIAARDFQPFIRVMPHAEYPSGSSSLCTAYAEFTDLFTQDMFGVYLDVLPVGGSVGLNLNCDGGNDSPWKFGCGASFHVKNMTELAYVCGESRLWGGMHFTAAIAGGIEVSTGLGQLGLDFMKTIKNGSNFTSTALRRHTRPTCPNRRNLRGE